MLIQDILRKLMKDRGYTTEYMGEKMGVTKQSVSSVLCGNKTVSIDRLIRYADALDCDIILRSRTHGQQEWHITEGGKAR